MSLFHKTKKSIFKYLCFLFALSLFAYCQSSDSSRYNYDDDRYDDERDSRRRTTSSRRDGASSLRSVDGSSSSSRSFTALRKRDFDGPDCRENKECRDFCTDIFPRKNRSQCEELPEDMVELLHAAYKNLENMRWRESDSDNSRSRIDPAALAAILDIDVDAVTALPKSRWGIREVREFLNWLADSSLAVKALEDEDPKNEVFKETLLAFSKRENAENRIIAALSLDIGQYFQTFLYQAQRADNERAVQYTFDFLNDNCGSGLSVKNCKLLILCAREEEEDGRYRARQTCPYLSGNRRRQREDFCYAQGPNVWSYINGLIDDNDLNDIDLESITEFNEEFCEEFCETNNCERTEF